MAAPRRLTGGYVALGIISAIVYVLSPNRTLASICAIFVGVASVAVVFWAPAMHQSTMRSTWRLLSGAGAMFLVGMVMRPWATKQPGLTVLSADIFTMSGYLLFAAVLVRMLRVAGNFDRHAVIDGLIVALGTMVPVVQYLALPASRVQGRPMLVSLVAGLYPAVDCVVLFLVVNLAFSTAVRLPSFQFMALSTGMLFIGDLAYAIIGARGQLNGPPIMDVPLILGFVAAGASAMHPSMTRMSFILAAPVQPWSWPRMCLILPALVAPSLVLIDLQRRSAPQLFAALVGLLLILITLIRATSAVRRLAETQERWLRQATHDSLTLLANRTQLVSRMDGHITSARSQHAWLVYLDLDDFKLVNDHWGHGAGDVLLQEVARRLTKVAGPGRTVARVGGDEFAIAGAGSQREAIDMSTAVVEALRTPITVNGLDVVTTASVGVVVRSDQPTAEDMVRDADVAMYRAKDAGRNRWQLFDSTMRMAIRHRVETEIALRTAVQDDELWVAYQPVVALASQRIVGVEALVRWDGPPGQDPVSPAVFIPVAEQTGLMPAIGSRVLERALLQLGEWRDAGLVSPEFSVSVNVSFRQLTDDSLLSVVSNALASGRVPPSCLIIEVTESGLFTDPQHAVAVLHSLRALGVGVSVDDFGTGYSSLNYLATLPITALKIDRSFVSGDAEGTSSDHQIVRAIVAMAHSLGLEITAEGVEDNCQREWLTHLTVDKGQGWLWGPAVSGEAFTELHLTGALESPHSPRMSGHPGGTTSSRG